MAKRTIPKTTTARSGSHPVAQVAGRVGGITVAAIALIVIFAKGYEWVAFPVTACLVILGIFLGHYASRK